MEASGKVLDITAVHYSLTSTSYVAFVSAGQVQDGLELEGWVSLSGREDGPVLESVPNQSEFFASGFPSKKVARPFSTIL